MKIAFFTEGNWYGKVLRTSNNLRTDASWMLALDADHHSLRLPNLESKYDIGIVIFPKNPITFNLDAIKNMCTKVGVMQEGPFWFYQDWSIEEQFKYISVLKTVDFVFVHNDSDKLYFDGLLGVDSIVLRPLIIEDSIKKDRIIGDSTGRTDVFIGGNFCSWYGGIDSTVLASSISDDIKIYAPSMGRMKPEESQITNVIHLPYMPWSNWLIELSKRRYGIHMMRTHAAGTFALACARLGIPCLGYSGLDTQEICHPHLHVKVSDMVEARTLIKELSTDENFYKLCSSVAVDRYYEFYTEEIWIENFEREINNRI